MMKKVLAFVLAVVMLLSLAACGGNSNTSSTTPAGSTGGETTNLKDTFVFAMGGQPEVQDPAIATDAVSATPLVMMYHTLFVLDENGAVQNNAVESYEIKEDGLVYELKLVDGNKWSDGEPVKASEYAFGAKRSLGMGSALSYYSYFIKDYVLNADKYEGADVADMTDIGIVADDEANTLTFTLKAPCSYFTSLLTNTVFTAVRPDVAVEHESTWADQANLPANGAYYATKMATNEEIV